MKTHPKIFIIAGEVSGDVLGARIMREMGDAKFIGIGGANMTAAGLKSLFPMGDLAVMGVVEVLAHARTLTRRMHDAADAIIHEKPDIVLTIDAPGFARGVVNMVRKSAAGKKLIESGLRFHHFVAPQVWAWRAGRAKKIARTFDKLYAFFDFEIPYFTKYGLDTIAVGHPLADGLIGRPTTCTTATSRIITLIPGSRMSEVKKLLPIFRDVAEQLATGNGAKYKFMMPTVETTDKYIREQINTWTAKPELVAADERYDLYARTYIAIAASGTVSAELAMLHIPAVIVYKMNAITTWLVRRVIRVRWVSLVNILMGRGIYPECLGDDATATNVLNAVRGLLLPKQRNAMIKSLAAADKIWQRDTRGAAAIIADDIRKTITKK